MIKRLVVKNLHQKFDFDIAFHPDLNIFTGRNGSGKTTLLKLIWYIISGNISKIFEEEIYFKGLILDAEYLSIQSQISVKRNNENRIDLTYLINGEKGHIIENGSIPETINWLSSPNRKPILTFDSLFFPTFRLTEGGFSIENTKIADVTLDYFLTLFSNSLSTFGALDNNKGRFSHRFISGVSTFNIEELVTQQYARNYVISGNIDKEQSKKILELTQNGENQAEETVKKIQTIVKEGEEKRKELAKPLSELSKIVEKLYLTHNIKIADFIIGDKMQTINATKLSSGEKQILMFLTYNALNEETAFFIDEPELSLHTDWQRLLFPTLMAQGSTNQFFVATHSPFIYSKFPDKEHFLDHLANK
jgi:predicted ATPase